jgi:hypothetical protein
VQLAELMADLDSKGLSHSGADNLVWAHCCVEAGGNAADNGHDFSPREKITYLLAGGPTRLGH